MIVDAEKKRLHLKNVCRQVLCYVNERQEQLPVGLTSKTCSEPFSALLKGVLVNLADSPRLWKLAREEIPLHMLCCTNGRRSNRGMLE